MKGIIFTGFLEMIEQKFGYELVDKMLTENDLESKGVYTSIGTYNYSEMVQLIVDLSARTEIAIPILLKEYGKYFFDVLYNSYPHFFKTVPSAFVFLESIENHIHIEVKKIYPKVELPTFETKMIGQDTLEIIYYSERKMADFAEGLIIRTLNYFQGPCSIIRENIKEDGSIVKFLLVRNKK
jgi:hypothetical protein